jgi:hypothetical protein
MNGRFPPQNTLVLQLFQIGLILIQSQININPIPISKAQNH